MKLLALSRLARWSGADLVGDDLVIQSIDIDTRSLQPGGVYVALRGERFDGHDFCAAAKAAGARALLVERKVEVELPQLVCPDTRLALAAIARELAATRSTCVIGITGSNGKTTTRTLLHGILQQVDAGAHANPGNHNNEIGLPLALIGQPESARFGIYEMGAGAPGDIAYLADILRPRVGMVTNVAAAHLERMGNLLGVADTKAAIYDALPADGTAVINADDAFAACFIERAGDRRILTCGLETNADVYARDILEEDDGSRFRLCTPQGEIEVSLPLPGRHQVANALAAAGLALAVDAPLAAIAAGLAQARGVPGRQQRLALVDGSIVLDDSYNANPGSVAVAVASLMAQARRHELPAWIALGDMRELGPGSAILHADVGRLARDAGVVKLLAVGEMSRQAVLAFGPGGEHFPSQEALLERLANRDHRPFVLLVKGSRGSRMDKIVVALLHGQARGGDHAA